MSILARAKRKLGQLVADLDDAHDWDDSYAESDGAPTFPHCDAKILHSPGNCRFCDDRPDWQAYRKWAGIAFSDTPAEEVARDKLVPCPSTYFRHGETRDRWHGNVPQGGEPE